VLSSLEQSFSDEAAAVATSLYLSVEPLAGKAEDNMGHARQRSQPWRCGLMMPWGRALEVSIAQYEDGAAK